MPPALVGIIKVFPRVIEASARFMDGIDESAMAQELAATIDAVKISCPEIRFELGGKEVVAGAWRGDLLDIAITDAVPLRSLLLPVAQRLTEEIRIGADEPIEILVLFETLRPLFLALYRELESLGITVQLRYEDLVLVKIGSQAEPVLSERYGNTEVYLSHMFKLFSDLFG